MLVPAFTQPRLENRIDAIAEPFASSRSPPRTSMTTKMGSIQNFLRTRKAPQLGDEPQGEIL